MKVHEFLIEADATKSYKIKPGDTLSRIAQDNSTTVDAIMSLNQGNRAIRDRDTIYAGGTIKLPTASTGFDSDARVKRQGATSVDKSAAVSKIGNQEFPLTKGPGPNDDMGGENFGIGDTDWEFPTVELGFGDPGYTPLIGSQVEKRPDGNWYYPGNPFPVRPNVSRFAEKRLKDLDIVKAKDLGSQKFPMTKGPDSKEKTAVPTIAPRPKDKLPTKPGQFSLEKNDISPIPGSVVTGEFDEKRGNRLHKGIDLRALVGTPILAPNNGRVLKKGFDESRGGFIILGDPQGNRTHQFMHLSDILVKNGEIVSQGQEIGKSGNTGYSQAPHLHWEKYVNGESVDPSKYVELPRKQ